MKMKMYRNLFKNAYVFWHSFCTKRIFRATLLFLLDRWGGGSPYRKNPLGYFWECKNYKEVKNKNTVAYSQRVKFLKLLKDNELSELHRHIDAFLGTNNLGEEWFNTITDYIISGWFSPPIYNLHIEEVDQKKGRGIALILNPDTSIDDVKEAWSWISKKQKQVWPNFKRPYWGRASLRNLFIAIQDLEERFGKERAELDIAKLRKYKTVDLDITSKIWRNAEDISENADKKRRINLRQIRSRFRQKLL